MWRVAAATACSRLSSTSTPAASARTKPSRSASNGRLARCGLVVAARERPHRVERRQADARDRRLRTAGDHDVGVAAADDLGAFAQRVAGRGAGARDAEVRALGAGLDGDQASQHIRQHHRHDERADPIRAARVQHHGRVDDGGDAADAAADDHAHPLGDRRRARRAPRRAALRARRPCPSCRKRSMRRASLRSR